MGQKSYLIVTFGALLISTFSVFMIVNGENIMTCIFDDDHNQSSPCQFPAIYNFGDSNSDTGCDSAIFGRLPWPYGMTYFHKPSGRHSDGRLIIDFIAERLGLPLLSPYADSIGTSFRHGADFAASGATIQPYDSEMLYKTASPLALDIQLSQFQQFRVRSAGLYYEANTTDEVRSRLPRLEDYPRALYTFDIGQNDLQGAITSNNVDQMKTYIPTIINEFASVVESLYNGRARTFQIHNTGPIGCLPSIVETYPPAPNDTDKVGCVKSYNEMAQYFNKHLIEKVSQLGTQLEEASFLYVDMYLIKYSLISEADKNGFIDPLGKCLGDDYKACTNPSEYISWDGVHYTEAANKWFADHLPDESLIIFKTDQ